MNEHYLEWINCLTINKKVNSVTDLSDGNVFIELLDKLGYNYKNNDQGNNKIIAQFIKDNFPHYDIEEDTWHQNEEEVKCISLLLLIYITLKHENANLRNAFSVHLSTSSQLFVKDFLEQVLETDQHITKNVIILAAKNVDKSEPIIKRIDSYSSRYSQGSCDFSTPVGSKRRSSTLLEFFQSPNTLKRMLDEKNIEQKRLKNELDNELMEKIDILQQNEDYKRSILNLNKQLIIKNAENKKLIDEVQHLQYQINATLQSNSELEIKQAVLEKTQGEVKELEKYVSNLEKEIYSCQEEISTYKKQVNILSDSESVLKEENQIWRNSSIENEERCKYLENKMNTLESDFTLASELVQELRNENESLKAECAVNNNGVALETELEIQENKRLKEEVSLISFEKNKLMEEHIALQKHTHDMEENHMKTLQTSKDDFESWGKENILKYESIIQEINKDYDVAINKYQSLNVETTNLKALNEDLLSVKKQLETELEFRNQNVESLKLRVKELNEALQESECGRTDIQNTYYETCCSFTNKLNVINNELAIRKEENDNLRQSIEKLELEKDKLKVDDGLKQELINNLEHKAKEVNFLNFQIQDLTKISERQLQITECLKLKLQTIQQDVNTNLENRLDEFLNKLKDANSTLFNLENTKNKFVCYISKLETDNTNLESKLVQESDMVKKLSAQISDIEKMFEIKLSQLEAAKQEVEKEYRAAVTNYQSDIQILTEKLQSADERVQDIITCKSNLKEIVVELQNEKESLLAEMKNKECDINTLNCQMKELEVMYKKRFEDMESLKNEFKIIKEESAHFVSHVAKLETYEEDLVNETNTTCNLLRVLQSKFSSNDEQDSSLCLEETEIDSEVVSSDQPRCCYLQIISDKIGFIDRKLKLIKLQVGNLSNLCDNIQETNYDLKASLKIKNDEIQSLNSEIANLKSNFQDEFNKLEISKRETEEVCKEINCNLNLKINELSAMNDELVALRKDDDTLNNQVVELKTENEQLESEGRLRKQSFDSLQCTITEMEEIFNQKVENLENDKRDLQEAYSENVCKYQRDVCELSVGLDASNNKLHQLGLAINSLENDKISIESEKCRLDEMISSSTEKVALLNRRIMQFIENNINVGLENMQSDNEGQCVLIESTKNMIEIIFSEFLDQTNHLNNSKSENDGLVRLVCKLEEIKGSLEKEVINQKNKINTLEMNIQQKLKEELTWSENTNCIQNEVDILNVKLQDLLNEIETSENIKNQLLAEKLQLENLVKLQTNNVELLNNQLVSTQNDFEDAKIKLRDSKIQVEESCEKNENLTKELNKVKKQLNTASCRLNDVINESIKQKLKKVELEDDLQLKEKYTEDLKREIENLKIKLVEFEDLVKENQSLRCDLEENVKLVHTTKSKILELEDDVAQETGPQQRRHSSNAWKNNPNHFDINYNNLRNMIKEYIVRMRSEKEHLQTAVDEGEKTTKNLKCELACLENRLATEAVQHQNSTKEIRSQLEQNTLEYKDEILHLTNKLRSSEINIENLENSINDLKRVNDNLLADKSNLQVEIENSLKRINDFDFEIVRLKDQFEKELDENNDSKIKLRKDHEEINNNLKNQIREYESQLDKCNEQLVTFRNKNNELTKHLACLEISIREKLFKEYEEKESKYKSEICVLVMEVKSLQDKIRQSEEKINSFKNANDHLKLEKDDLIQEIELKTKNTDSFKSEMIKVEQNLAEKLKELDNLNKSVERTKKETNMSYESNLHLLTSQLNTVNHKYSKLTKENNNLKELNKVLQHDKDELQQVLNTKTESNDNLKLEAIQVQEKLNEIENYKQEAERKLSDMNKLQEEILCLFNDVNAQKDSKMISSESHDYILKRIKELVSNMIKENEMNERKLSKLREQIIEKVRLEYEGKLQRAKAELKKVFVQQQQELNDTSIRRENEYKIQIHKQKEHIESLSSQFWDISDKYLKLQQMNKRESMLSLITCNSQQNSLMSPGTLMQKSRSATNLTSWEYKVKDDHDFDSRFSDFFEAVPRQARRKAASSTIGKKLLLTSGKVFPTADEESEVFDNSVLSDLKGEKFIGTDNSIDAKRLSVLQARNSLCQPHLKSSYPLETQFLPPTILKENEIKMSLGNIIEDNDFENIPPGELRHRKTRNQTSYKKPGPPTPSKNGGRLFQADTPKNILRELSANGNGNKRKSFTPSKLLNLFGARGQAAALTTTVPQNENPSIGTPLGKLHSIRKRFSKIQDAAGGNSNNPFM